ncbi:DUF3987 domain-containing protein [Nonomuraea deserti]|uniref:DUF3987 domain-containing protein n=1 Tax=Nonomuraea deserti TaxID=1848322 RepID=A0A4R4U382_9ACTN|nr:DUF3987 domain-containing protein [Nonomuraea deserti]TDC85718.1 DUF3987 domain-containing protein [Nonomuraea deserti]
MSATEPNWAPDIGKPGLKARADAPGGEDTWDEIIPLGSRLIPPTFPIACLPAWLQAMVEAVAEETQTPPDIAAAFGLGGLSAAAGGKAEVRVRGGWQEPVHLFLASVAPPATRKSAVFRAMTAPLYAAEETLILAGRARTRQAELLRLQLEEADKQARTKAVRSGSANDLAEAESTALALADAAVPHEVQLIAKNVTPEECSTILSEQGGRLAILSAEGDIFDIVCGRYSNGVPALTPFLEAHAGSTSDPDDTETISKLCGQIALPYWETSVDASGRRQRTRRWIVPSSGGFCAGGLPGVAPDHGPGAGVDGDAVQVGVHRDDRARAVDGTAAGTR